MTADNWYTAYYFTPHYRFMGNMSIIADSVDEARDEAREILKAKGYKLAMIASNEEDTPKVVWANMENA